MKYAIITHAVAQRLKQLLTNDKQEFCFPSFQSFENLLARLNIYIGTEESLSERQFKFLIPLIQAGEQSIPLNILHQHLCFRFFGHNYTGVDFQADLAKLLECNILLVETGNIKINYFGPSYVSTQQGYKVSDYISQGVVVLPSGNGYSNSHSNGNGNGNSNGSQVSAAGGLRVAKKRGRAPVEADSSKEILKKLKAANNRKQEEKPETKNEETIKKLCAEINALKAAKEAQDHCQTALESRIAILEAYGQAVNVATAGISAAQTTLNEFMHLLQRDFYTAMACFKVIQAAHPSMPHLDLSSGEDKEPAVAVPQPAQAVSQQAAVPVAATTILSFIRETTAQLPSDTVAKEIKAEPFACKAGIGLSIFEQLHFKPNMSESSNYEASQNVPRLGQ